MSAPPKSSLHDGGSASIQGDTERRAQAVRFRRALSLLGMTLVAPGSAQIVAGNRSLGRFALRVALMALVMALAVGGLWLLSPKAVITLFGHESVLAVIRYVLLILGGLWAVLFVDAWRLGQPMALARTHRLRVFGLTGVLAIGTSAAVLVAANAVGSLQVVVSDVFTGGGAGERDGRYNILLLGGDAGEDREGLRPDSITVASVDAETGASILFGLPRNMQNVPFTEDSPMHDEWPDGFDCGDECLLNGVYTWAEDHADLFEGEDRPGVAATQSAVEAITGLEISYTALIDLQGFEQLVNAVGGVTINVGKRVPIGIEGGRIQGWIETGEQRMDGGTALWFARSRRDSNDYERMARQRCVMSAMLKQIDPQTVLTNFQSLASASAETIWTDVPVTDLPDLLSVAGKARAQAPVSVSFVPPLVEPVHPDFRQIRRLVEDAIDPPEMAETDVTEPQEQQPATAGEAAGSARGSASLRRVAIPRFGQDLWLAV